MCCFLILLAVGEAAARAQANVGLEISLETPFLALTYICHCRADYRRNPFLAGNNLCSITDAGLCRVLQKPGLGGEAGLS